MAKPLLATDSIYDTALHLLEVEGVGALSARNLAAALKCSTRTLYQQVGKRGDTHRRPGRTLLRQRETQLSRGS